MAFGAIDCGTSSLKLAAPGLSGEPEVIQNSETGELLTPSAVVLGEPLLFGNDALNARLTSPEKFIANLKRHLGTSEVLGTHAEVEFTARKLITLQLRAVSAHYRAATGDELTEVAVTIPATFGHAARRELEEAVREAGLALVVLPQEPSAALWWLVRDRASGKYLVIDFGAGTFDLSLAEVNGDRVQILATGGLPHNGGADMTGLLHKELLARIESQTKHPVTLKNDPLGYARLLATAEAMKLALTKTKQMTVNTVLKDGKTVSLKFRREEYEAAILPVVSGAVGATTAFLKEHGIAPSELREVVLTGGASQTPLFQRELEKALGRKPAPQTEYLHAVVKGALMFLRQEVERSGRVFRVRGRSLPPLPGAASDVSAHPVSVLAYAPELKRLAATVLVPKGAPLPSTTCERFALLEPNQTTVDIAFVQGAEGALPEHCVGIGNVKVSDLAALEQHLIEVSVTHSVSGIVRVQVKDLPSGRTFDATLEKPAG